jgi:hypothetical protein
MDKIQLVYKYIYFENITSLYNIHRKRKTEVYRCCNKNSGDILGEVKWYSPWRQYCFFVEDAIFSKGCLKDITNFINKLMENRKNKNG